MGSKKIEVSRLGRIVSANVRAQLGIRHMSNRELARQMGRGETYVRARVNDEKEWTINDLEILGELWGLSPAQLVVPITGVESVAVPDAPSGVDALAGAVAADPEEVDIDAWADRIKEEDGVGAE